MAIFTAEHGQVVRGIKGLADRAILNRIPLIFDRFRISSIMKAFTSIKYALARERNGTSGRVVFMVF